MENWLNVKSVMTILNCCEDTARARMEEMRDVVNVGTQKRRQLMVSESALQDWLRNHRISARVEIVVPKFGMNKDGKLARMDRRTGKLKAV